MSHDLPVGADGVGGLEAVVFFRHLLRRSLQNVLHPGISELVPGTQGILRTDGWFFLSGFVLSPFVLGPFVLGPCPLTNDDPGRYRKAQHDYSKKRLHKLALLSRIRSPTAEVSIEWLLPAEKEVMSSTGTDSDYGQSWAAW